MRPIELRCTLLSYTAHPYELAHRHWAPMRPTELRWTLLSYAEPHWARLYPAELRCSLLSYAALFELHNSLTELPSILVPLCNFVKCRKAGLSGTGISVPQSGTGRLRYRTEMLDAGILIPAALVTMPMPNCGHSEIQINWLFYIVKNLQ
jgi:hypothetical protein